MRIEIDLNGNITKHEDAPVIERPIEEIEAERIQAIKSKANQLILAKYPIEKQSSAQLGIYGEDYLQDMVSFIKNIISISNKAEVDGLQVGEIIWQ